MKQDEIIAIARKAELWGYEMAIGGEKELEAFFNMAFAAGAAHEREACAKVCDAYGESVDNEWNRGLGVANDLKDIADECAIAIRARGENGTA